MYWSVLRCVAVCDSVMQCAAVCCSMLQCVAVCWLWALRNMQRVAVCVAVCCIVLAGAPCSMSLVSMTDSYMQHDSFIFPT